MKREAPKTTENENRQADISGIWIIPYADFITVLMIFFLLMFAFAYTSKDEHYEKIVTAIQQEMGGKVSRELVEKMLEQEKEINAANKIDAVIEKQNLRKYVNVTSNSEFIKVVFNNPVLFDSGSAELNPECMPVLHDVAGVLREMPNEIIVEGHTDNVPVLGGKYQSNWELSVARAMAVIRYLSHVEGVPYRRFAAGGYGEYRPLYPNDTEENRCLNRRIEINIVRKKYAG